VWVPRLTPSDVEGMEFGRAMRGYAMAEVDSFLDAVAARLDWLQRTAAAGPAAIWEAQPHVLRLLQDIRRTEFTKALNGYAQLQVDTFLDELAEDLERLVQRFGFERVAARVAAATEQQDLAQAARLTPLDIEQKQFSRVSGGYATAQLDSFLDEAAASYATLIDRRDHLRSLLGQQVGDQDRDGGGPPMSQAPLLTPADIEQQQFDKAIRGYDMREVDAFLDRLVAAFYAVLQESAALREELDRRAVQEAYEAQQAYQAYHQAYEAQQAYQAYEAQAQQAYQAQQAAYLAARAYLPSHAHPRQGYLQPGQPGWYPGQPPPAYPEQPSWPGPGWSG
jgi:DivIVA domain-containing protein